MNNFRRLLENYIGKLEAGKFPKYSDIKSLLRTLKREASKEDSAIFDELDKAFRGRYDLLDQFDDSRKSLAQKKIRDTIELDRRYRRAGDWYNEADDDEGTDGELQAAELISAVDIIYYLIFRADVSPNKFPGLYNLEDSCILGLAKLISAFTGDFKLLKVALLREQNKQTLLPEMIEYLPNLAFERQRFTDKETRDFHRLVLDNVDRATLRENLVLVYGQFDKENDELAGDRKDLFTALALIGLVCGDRRIQTMIDLSRFWSDRNGEPYILAGVERTVVYGAEALRIMENDGAEGIKRKTNQKRTENSFRLLTLVLPILQNVARHHLRDFSTRSLRAQVDRIRSRGHNAYFQEYRQVDRERHDSFIACLNEFT